MKTPPLSSAERQRRFRAANPGYYAARRRKVSRATAAARLAAHAPADAVPTDAAPTDAAPAPEGEPRPSSAVNATPATSRMN